MKLMDLELGLVLQSAADESAPRYNYIINLDQIIYLEGSADNTKIYLYGMDGYFVSDKMIEDLKKLIEEYYNNNDDK